MTAWYLPAGTSGRSGWEVVVQPDGAWSHTGLRVADLSGAGELVLPAGDVERMVVPLSGAVDVASTAGAFHLAGRIDVFAGPSDVCYLSPGVRAVLRGAGRVAVAEAPAADGPPCAVLEAGRVPVELRGAGAASRQVHNFGTPGALEARNLIVCEVYTPSGNWSSYPPHKHDEERPGHETALEEIYYFECRTSPRPDASGPTDPALTDAAAPAPTGGGAASHPGDPHGYMRVSASGPAHPIDVTEEIRTGDVVLVPHGWHGPAMAAPGYDMYYLNVMAGPGPERAWRIVDHPDHGWVRGTWPDTAPDPRLPWGPGA